MDVRPLDGGGAIVPSIISIHIGGAGVRLGHAFWTRICALDGVSNSGSVSASGLQDRTLFRKVSSNRQAARAIFADQATQEIGAVRQGPLRAIFAPDDCRVGQIRPSRLWAEGHLADEGLVGHILQRVGHHNTHAEPGTPTYFVTLGLSGGTGGGLGSRLVKQLRAAHPHAVIVVAAVWGDPQQLSAHPMNYYNEVLTLRHLRDAADACLVLHNKSLNAAATAVNGSAGSDFAFQNELAARALAEFWNATRRGADGPGRMTPRELVRTLEASPGASLVSLAIDARQGSSPSDSVAALLTSSAQLSGHADTQGKRISPVFIAPQGRTLEPRRLREDRRLSWPSWYPPAARVVHTTSPGPWVVLAQTHTGVVVPLDAARSVFAQMFARKAMLNPYLSRGVTEADFTASLASIDAWRTSHHNA